MRVLVTLLLIFIVVPASGQTITRSPGDADLKIRAFLEPENGVYVGQLARLWVEISSFNRIARAPNYPDLQLKGTIVIMPNQFGVNFTQSIRGKTRIGQRQRYAIIPQREGTIIIPAVKVTLSLMVDGTESEPITLQTKPVKLIAKFPPGTKYLGRILTTENLSVKENYDRETEGLKVGDTITRTVTLHGENTFALALPPTEFVAVEGARVYPAQPILSDQTNRGDYKGTRVDAGTYVLEKAQEILLPEIVIRWWNPESNSLDETILPAVSFRVEANPAFQNSTGSPIEKSNLVQKLKRGAFVIFDWLRGNVIWLTITAICFYTLVLMFKRFLPTLIQLWKNWRKRAHASESRYFVEFRRACLSNNKSEITRTFWRWIDSRYSGTQVQTLEMAGMRNTNADMYDYFKLLEKQYYGDRKEQQKQIDGHELFRRVKDLRKAINNRALMNPKPDYSRLNPVRFD